MKTIMIIMILTTDDKKRPVHRPRAHEKINFKASLDQCKADEQKRGDELRELLEKQKKV